MENSPPPKVSVIVPTHNRPEMLKRAVNSVLNQTYRDFEVIVIDDGLEKRADEIINSLNDSRLKYIQHLEEKGGSVARNTGIKNANGEFVAFLDDDDEWLSHKLATQMAQFGLTPHNVGFCFSAVENVYSDRSYITTVPSGIGDYHQLALSYFKSLLTVTLVVKKYIFQETGLFDENFPSHQEAELMIRVTEKFKGLGINQPLVKVAMGGHDQVGGSLKRRILGREMLLAKHMKEFENDKKLLADQSFSLGLMYRDDFQFKKAGNMFKKAVKNDFSIKYFAHSLSMIFGGRVYRFIRIKKLSK
ncbi:MAG: glycosyltransferase family A protein [Patescibacteria group bacterium]